MADSESWEKFQFYTDQIPLMQGEYYVEGSPAADFIYRYGFQEMIEAGWALVPQYELNLIDASISEYDFKDSNPYTRDDTYWEWEDHGYDTFLGHVPIWIYVPVHQSYAELVFQQKSKDIHTHTIAADQAIGIEFCGYDSGRIDVISSGDLVLAGSIRNDAGATTLLAQGSIEQQDSGETPVIRSSDLALYAGEGIGNDLPVRINLDGGAVTARTSSGDIRMEEITGDLTVREITIPHFDPFAGPGQILSFVPANDIDDSVYTIELDHAHGLVTGEVITYGSGGGAAVGGLTDGGTYSVLVVNTTTVMLAPRTTDPAVLETAESDLETQGISAVQELVIHLDRSLSTGTDHRLIVGSGQAEGIECDLSGSATIEEGVIDLGQPHGFHTGQAVVYTQVTGDAVPGLEDGGTYYVYVVDDTRIRLAESRDDLVSYLPDLLELDGSVATGFDHSFDPVDGGTTVAVNPFTVTGRTALYPSPGYGYVDYLADRIQFGYAHGLTTGRDVTYVQGSSPINGLVDGQTYYVIVDGDSAIGLSLTEDDALNRRRIDLKNSDGKDGLTISLGGFGTFFIPGSNLDWTVQPTFMVEQTDEMVSFALNPTEAIGAYQSTIQFPQAHLLNTGDALVYHCSGGGDPIDALVDGGTYFAEVVDQTTIKLKDAQGQIITIGVPSTPASTHTFTRTADLTVTPRSPFPLFVSVDPSAGAVVLGPGDVDVQGDRLAAPGHGFLDGEVVLYRNTGGAVGGFADGAYYTIAQADADSFALSDGATTIDLTSAGSGDHTFYSAVRLPVNSVAGLSIGDAVQYQLEGGTGATIYPIGGLTAGTVYYVVAVDRCSVQLSDAAAGTPIVVDGSVATPGEVHQLARQVSGTTAFNPFDGVLTVEASQNAVIFDPSLQATAGVIVLDHPFVDGQEVVYESGYHPIGGLQDGNTYVVEWVSTHTISLKETPGSELLSLDFDAATGAEHNLSLDGISMGMDFSLVEGCLVTDADHGFVDGREVVYENDDGAVGTIYHVLVIDARTLQLSLEDGGDPIRLDLEHTTGTGHRLTPVGGGTSVSFDPTTQGRYLVFSEGHSLRDNDLVVYRTGSSASIGGLTDGGTYTVRIDGRTLRLLDAGGTPIDLDYGGGERHLPHPPIPDGRYR